MSQSIYLNNPKAVFGFSVPSQSSSAETNLDSASSSSAVEENAARLRLLHKDLKYVVKNIIGGDWNSLADDQITVRPLCGGISNLLFLLETKDIRSDNSVIVRLFGDGTDAIIDRDRENTIIATLSKLNFLSPIFYGLFENGRVEGFFKGTRSLLPEEMYHPELMPRIAKALSSFNNVDLSAYIPNEALCFLETDDFFRIISTIEFSDIVKQKAVDDLNLSSILADYNQFKAELLKKINDIDNKSLESCNFKDLGMKFAFEKVVAHNDLLSGNILLDTTLKTIKLNSNNSESENPATVFAVEVSEGAGGPSAKSSVDLSGLILIDFEYAGYNYRGYDIGNHFNEYAGFDFEIVKYFPNSQQRMDFYIYYIYSSYGASKARSSESALSSAILRGLPCPDINTDSNGDFAISYPNESSSSSLIEFISGFDEATLYLSTLPNLFWGTWAIYQAFNSPIDFDYVGYAKKRFDGYSYIKNHVMISTPPN
jgi:ethanolamine kinase